MENTAITNANSYMPMGEMAGYHQQLLERYESGTQPAPNPDAPLLMQFNGYYTLGTAPGAFFAVDTNMVIQRTSPTPNYEVTLLISLDGITSSRFPFTGTFNGTQLTQSGGKTEASINLTFTRTNGSDGTTATCTGIIKLNGSEPFVNVLGSTYNNPIPASLFTGTYYDMPSLAPVMSIDNYQVSYDDGTGSGILKPVPAYTYNLNMYYFSFIQLTTKVGLIMGTSGAKGFACNDMVVDQNGIVTTRNLQTVTIANEPLQPEWYDISSLQLAGFSGYYQIPSPSAPLAFVSVQAQYATASGSLDIYNAMISVSMDGVTSNGYYFDPLKMTFANGVLTMPAQSITLTFNRQYDPSNGSLVSMVGSVNGQPVNGYTLFNPVPLSAFAGITMTNIDGKSLTVINDNEVIYCGTKMDAIIYVPLMYILAYPIKSPTIVMSFGTSGLKGNACIVMENADTKHPKIYFVYAIPDGQS